MKLSNLLITLAALLFIQCSDNNDLIIPDLNTTPDADVYTTMSQFWEQNRPDPLTFEFDPTQAQTIPTGNGTTLNFPANAFLVGGVAPTGNLTLEIREMQTLEELFWNNAQTASNGFPLVTGGSIYTRVIDASGTEATLVGAVDASLTVETDVTGYENDLTYFIGTETNVDGQEVVNWFEAGSSQSFLEGNQFSIFGMDLGWANCDALYDLAGESPTQFSVLPVPGEGTWVSGTVWLFIDDFPSVINITSRDGDNYVTYDNSIPTGLNATLVAVGIDENGYLMFGSLEITVAGDDMFNVPVNYGTTANLVTLVNTIAN